MCYHSLLAACPAESMPWPRLLLLTFSDVNEKAEDYLNYTTETYLRHKTKEIKEKKKKEVEKETEVRKRRDNRPHD